MWVNIFRAAQEVTRILNPSISDSKVFMTLLGDFYPQRVVTASTGAWLCYWINAHCTFSLWPLSLGTNLMPELDHLPTVLPSWLVFLPFWPKWSPLVVSDSLWPRGLEPEEYWSGLPFPSQAFAMSGSIYTWFICWLQLKVTFCLGRKFTKEMRWFPRELCYCQPEKHTRGTACTRTWNPKRPLKIS